jgi:hypothetical protein
MLEEYFSKLNNFFGIQLCVGGAKLFPACSPMLPEYSAGAMHFVTVVFFISTTEVRYWLSF